MRSERFSFVGGIIYVAGWRSAFLITGIFGFLRVVIFQIFIRRHPELSQTDKTATLPRRPWIELLAYRETWAVFICRFLADPVWYFYLFWIPSFLSQERGLHLGGIALVAGIP